MEPWKYIQFLKLKRVVDYDWRMESLWRNRRFPPESEPGQPMTCSMYHATELGAHVPSREEMLNVCLGMQTDFWGPKNQNFNIFKYPKLSALDALS